MKERLQKILARAGVGSRRKAETLIAEGRVKVDGLVVNQPGTLADPEQQQITFDGHPLRLPTRATTILLNKPRGYVTTMHDPQGRPIVTSLIREKELRLFPVGRLDLDTEGALLLTNDGDLAQRILHPKHEINRTYVATVQGAPKADQLAALRQGIVIEERRTWPATIKVLKREGATTTLEVVIHEGRKRQVRKMFEAIGHPVLHLKRIAYGGLRLERLPVGAYRRLNEEDLRKIFNCAPQDKIPFTSSGMAG